MAVVCPGRKTRMVLDIVCFLLCFLFILLQQGLLDYYFIRYLKESYWYSWVAGDVIIIIVMLWLLIVAIRYNQKCMEETCLSDSNVKYAFLAWFVYSLVLVGKVAVTFRLYHDKIGVEASDDEYGTWFGRHTFKLTLALSAIIFLLLVEAHHYTTLNSPRQLYLSYLATSVTLDLLDSIYFLELLWRKETEGIVKENLPLEICILVFACINFVLPTFALLRLRFVKLPKRFPLPYPVVYTFFYILLVNVPYLAIRIYLSTMANLDRSDSNQATDDISIFAIKNLIFIYLGLRELWTRMQYHRFKKIMASGSHGELTAGCMINETEEKGHPM